MIIFFITFFTLYGLLHVNFFFRLKKAIGSMNFFAQLALIIILFILWLSPFLIRILERKGYETPVEFLAWIGYVWMAFVFLFFFFSIVLDLLRIGIYLAKKISVIDYSQPFINNKNAFILNFILCSILIFYGYLEAKNIRVKPIEIHSEKVTREVKIIQISDLHLGLIVREARLKKVTEQIRQFNPHIIVSTGDLVDGQLDKIEPLSELFKELTPAFGKYAILGNHEVYAGLERAVKFTEMSGFKILRNEGIHIKELNLNIIGVDDNTVLGVRPDETFSLEMELLKKFKGTSFNIFLKHRPLIRDDISKLFDLQLSGHTHGGQLFPFSLITRLYYLNHNSLLKLPSGSYLYTSSGTGTWGPPIRIGSSPEITFIVIKPTR